MNKKEFIELVFEDKDEDKVEVKKYIVDKIGLDIYNKLEQYMKTSNNHVHEKPEPGTMLEPDPVYTDDQVEDIESILSSLPIDVSFYYFRFFYMEKQLKDFINDGDMISKIAELRGMDYASGK